MPTKLQQINPENLPEEVPESWFKIVKAVPGVAVKLPSEGDNLGLPVRVYPA